MFLSGSREPSTRVVRRSLLRYRPATRRRCERVSGSSRSQGTRNWRAEPETAISSAIAATTVLAVAATSHSRGEHFVVGASSSRRRQPVQPVQPVQLVQLRTAMLQQLL